MIRAGNRAIAIVLLCVLAAGCACDADCGPPVDPVEFVGLLVSVDLGSGHGADGGDIAVYRIVSWTSGSTDTGTPPSSMAVSYWQTGQLLEVGNKYLVGAERLPSGTYHSSIPTSESCTCGSTTRRSDGSPVDQGLLRRWLTVTRWQVAVAGGAIGAAIWFLLTRRRHRSWPIHLVGGTLSVVAGVCVAGVVDQFDPEARPANTIHSLVGAAVALACIVVALFVRRIGVQSDS